MNPKLQRFIQTVGDLPSMPGLAASVMQAIQRTDTSADELRKIIEQDPALAVRILKVANSSLYGFSREIQTLTHAIALMGFKAVSSLVLAASMRRAFKHFGLAEKLLWEHATVSGAVASRLARFGKVGVDPEEAFVAGLLHDLGKIALNNEAREAYQKVISRVYNEGVSFVDAECDEFGFDHAEIGALVIAKWKLSSKLESAIRHHHDAKALTTLPHDEARLCAVVMITTRCCTRLGIGRREGIPEIDPCTMPAWSFLDLEPEDLDAILEIVEEQTDTMRSIDTA